MNTLQRLVFGILFCAALPILAATPIDVFDFKQACLSEQALEELASLPRDHSNATISPEIFRYMVRNKQALQGKAKTAYTNLLLVDRFFRQEFNWQSTDNKNSPIILLTNLEHQPCGREAVNAFFMTLGANHARVIAVLFGHKQATEDLADDIDVLGHEFTHGVFSATQGRRLEFELTALNEAIGDIFGVTIRAWHESGENLNQTRARQNSFKLGQQTGAIYRKYYHVDMPAGSLRDNQNPRLNNPPGAIHYAELQQSEHNKYMASSVISYAYVLLVKGKTLATGQTVQGIGFERAIKIIFYTLKHRLPFNSMPEFALAVKKAARKIHGRESAEVVAVHNAFAAVGLFENAFEPAAVEQAVEADVSVKSEPDSTEREEPVPSQTQQAEQQQDQEPAETQAQQQEASEQALATVSPSSLLFIFLGFLLLLVAVAWSLSRSRQRQLQAQLQQRVTDIDPFQAFDASAPVVAQPALATQKIATEHFREAKHAEGLAISAVIEVQGEAFALELDHQPIIVGRADSLNLPKALKAMLAQDVYMGREHCQVWYKAATRELYVLCQSSNGMQLNEHDISQNHKVKVNFNKVVNLVLGKTRITIAPLK